MNKNAFSWFLQSFCMISCMFLYSLLQIFWLYAIKFFSNWFFTYKSFCILLNLSFSINNSCYIKVLKCSCEGSSENRNWKRESIVHLVLQKKWLFTSNLYTFCILHWTLKLSLIIVYLHSELIALEEFYFDAWYIALLAMLQRAQYVLFWPHLLDANLGGILSPLMNIGVGG